jgi:hypothetical protein
VHAGAADDLVGHVHDVHDGNDHGRRFQHGDLRDHGRSLDDDRNDVDHGATE